MIQPNQLGSPLFLSDYGVRYAYITGSMYKGIGSKELVVRMGQAGLLGFLGTGGLGLGVIKEAIAFIQSQLTQSQAYGMNLLCNLGQPENEMSQVDLFLQTGIRHVEASAFVQITPALVRFRLTGLKRSPQGKVVLPHTLIAKVSRPEVATFFMSPAPQKIVQELVAAGHLTKSEAELGEQIPMAHDICVEADSGGHTDQGVAHVLIPTIHRLKERMMAQFHYDKPLRIGAAGGIGTPEAAAAAFLLGADFIVTGSINQCTVEAGTSDSVKDLLQAMNIQDTTYAPAGDMFEMGARVQVLKKGLFFPARANKLYELYKHCNALEQIDEKTSQLIQTKYFKKTFDEVWQECQKYYAKESPSEIEKAEQNPKHKMALIFRWYFSYTGCLALEGEESQRVDYQIHCGPALGAFNQWVKGTELESWQNRHVDQIAEKLMQGAARWLTDYMGSFTQEPKSSNTPVRLETVIKPQLVN